MRAGGCGCGSAASAADGGDAPVQNDALVQYAEAGALAAAGVLPAYDMVQLITHLLAEQSTAPLRVCITSCSKVRLPVQP